MLPEKKEAMRFRDAQKGAQHQDTSIRRCAWYAGQNLYSEGVCVDIRQAYTLLHLKQWRAVATRSGNRAFSFWAIVQARCIALYCKKS